MKQAASVLVAAGWLSAAGCAGPTQLVTRDVYLMGTAASLATYAASRAEGLATLEAALEVLQHAEGELSTWRDDSDISRLNRQPVGDAWPASPRLCEMFAEVSRWRDATGGAFDPAIGPLLGAWNVHGPGSLPTAETLARARASSGLALLRFDRTACTLTRTAEVTIDVGAFGKGEALDRVEAALAATPWMIDLGGHVSVGGDATPDGGWRIAIAHPLHRDRPYLEVRMREGSLATSGGSERDLVVDGTRVGHILDPRTGRPATFAGSVTVWHRRGLVADALSTALYVKGPDEGLPWAEERGLAVCYLIPDGDDVTVMTTRAFRALVG